VPVRVRVGLVRAVAAQMNAHVRNSNHVLGTGVKGIAGSTDAGVGEMVCMLRSTPGMLFLAALVDMINAHRL
jgi:hypothetical protein